MAFRTLNNRELVKANFRQSHRLRIEVRGEEPSDLVAYAAYRQGPNAYYLGFNIADTISLDSESRRGPIFHTPRLDWSEAIPFRELRVDLGGSGPGGGPG